MPIYAYECTSCGFAKDVLQKISDAPLSVCPSCGQPTLRKQVTAAGFQLKGSGWYVTDFRGSGGGKGAGENDGKSAPAASGGSEAAAPAAAEAGKAASAKPKQPAEGAKTAAASKPPAP
ncbi:MAG: zinc ribbon domain-containing protein [Burkholderiaceae bacterium]|jgi:putative FmdB family regulatory protein|nr:zinc ribbon domain-containing protein [Burkholderiaceae bacterium]